MLRIKQIKDHDIQTIIKGEVIAYQVCENDNVLGEAVSVLKDAGITVISLNTEDIDVADGLLRTMFDKAASQNALFYSFDSEVQSKWSARLEPMGYSMKEDYIYKFFTSTHKCTSCGKCKSGEE